MEEEYKSDPAYQFNNYGDKLTHEIMILILSQSTDLIPEIENAYNKGSFNHYSQYTDEYYNLREKDILNLKLDI